MLTTQPSATITAEIENPADPAKAHAETLKGILADILGTREARQLLSTVVPAFLHVWAGSSWWKKTLSKMAGSMVENQMSHPDDVLGKDEIGALLENERFIKDVTAQLPGVINSAVDALADGAGSIEGMPLEDKQQLFAELLSQTGKGKTGAVLTTCAQTLNAIHSADPKFFTEAIEPGFQKWVESVDFGELKEMFDNSGTDGRAFVEMVMTVLFEYPAKFVLLLAYLPGLVNFITDALKIIIEKVNTFPPDMLTDVVLALGKEINGVSIANLLNQLTEVVRKIHTGSGLLGEPGSPRLPNDLSDMLGDIISQVDLVILWKSKIALAEINASIAQAMAAAVKNNPAYRQLNMIKGPELTNIRLRSLNQKLSSWDFVEDGELAKSWAQHLAAYDAQEAAEVANNVLRLAERLATENPAIFSEFIGQFTNALDEYQLTETAKHVFNSAGAETRSVARAIVPGFVTWICDVLQPEDDEYEDEAEKARKALQFLFANNLLSN